MAFTFKWMQPGLAPAIALVSLALATASMPLQTVASQGHRVPIQRPATSAGHFTHVIVIQQENRTIDNLFNGFPGADTVQIGMRKGAQVQLRQTPLQPTAALDHSHKGFVLDYNDGYMDGFDHKNKRGVTAYTYVRPADVKNYWDLASRFTLADETFQMNMGPSFPAHVYLIAGQGGSPFTFAGNTKVTDGAGCLGWATVSLVDLRTQFPGKQSRGPACMDMPTLLDSLDERGLGWRYYAPASGDGLYYWSAPDYVQHLALGTDHEFLVNPETRILGDIAAGTLAPVSFVSPSYCTSDHPRRGAYDPLGGPLWVAEITNAIGESAYWDSTLILVTWDDWGGLYDHVAPTILNSDSYGFRTPLLIVSAYDAAPGVVDHTRRSQASILTAIETVFGLPTLGQLDAQSDDLSADFDFSHNNRYGRPLPAAPPPPNCNLQEVPD